MILETNQVILRPILLSDAQDILNLRSNEIVNLFIKRIPPKSLEDAENFIKNIHQKIARKEMLFGGISIKEFSKIIGTISLWKIANDQKNAELGYELLPNFHRKGIML
jgi:ribosomal-protein-alanine N-acetyltransferase